MRLHRLHLVNFRQHRDTDIEFGPGLTGIIGPNGTGKSTLLEAIAWAIYGMEAARGTRDSIRWRRAKARSEVKVELEFGLGAHEYRVVRTLYGADLFLDAAPQPIATTINEVSSRLTRVLGISRDEFFNTYFTGHKACRMFSRCQPQPACFHSYKPHLVIHDKWIEKPHRVASTAYARHCIVWQTTFRALNLRASF